MRASMSSGGRPVKLKATLTTGILMFGKMSVGGLSAEATPKIMMSSAMTMKVYGRRSASLTMPIMIASRPCLPRIRSSLRQPCGAGQHQRRHGERSHGRPAVGDQQQLGGHDDRDDGDGGQIAEQRFQEPAHRFAP